MIETAGHISQVIGPVVDVHFDIVGADASEALPRIHDALSIDRGDGKPSSLKFTSTLEKTL